MNDHELDALLLRAAAVTDNDIAEWIRDAPFDELCEEIMSTTDPTHQPDAPATIQLRNHQPTQQNVT